jgi:hypothetical protein
MREDEADEPTEIPAVVRDEHVDIWNDFSGMPDFTDLDSLLSPPLLQDVQSSDGSAGNEIITPQHHDLSLQDQFQVPSGCNDTYVRLSGSISMNAETVAGILWIQPSIHCYGIWRLTSNLISSLLALTILSPINQPQGSVRV